MKKRLIGWLRRIVGVSSTPLCAVPVAPEWTKEDAANWKQFLRTPTGQALWIRARAMEAATCVKACAGRANHRMAGGISYSLNWLESLATISGDSPAKESTTDTDELAERHESNDLSYA